MYKFLRGTCFVLAISILAGCSQTQYQPDLGTVPVSSPTPGASSQIFEWCVVPKGESKVCQNQSFVEGITATTALQQFDLVSTRITIGLKKTDFGNFVESVNGYKPDTSKEFWEFAVNGTQASVGIDQYKVKAEDKLELRLAAIR